MKKINWHALLMPDTPLLEIFIRGSLMYLSLFIMLRLVLRRESGNVGMTDTLVVVLLADAAQNGMADDYTSIPDGIVLVAVILGWSHLLNFLAYHSRFFHWLLHPTKLLVIKDGKMLRRNMRRELITPEELMTEVRKEGCLKVEEVDRAYMESDGTFSFILKKQPAPREASEKGRGSDH